MREKGWCVHTRSEVTPYVDAEYYWEFCPICGFPKDNNKLTKTIDEIFANVLNKILIAFCVLFIFLVALLLLK
jgi:hypothetical protein